MRLIILLVVVETFAFTLRGQGAELPVYPPDGYFLVKGVCQHDYVSGKHDVTYQVAEVLCGPGALKDRYFLATFADVSRKDDTAIRLANRSRCRLGEVTYHWITVMNGPDGPLTKDVPYGAVQKGKRQLDSPDTPLKAILLRHASLTVMGVSNIRNPQLGPEDLVPHPRKFPMTGELNPDFQKKVDRRKAAGKDPYRPAYVGEPQFIIPPSKKDAEEWMAALKEFCNTKDKAAREKLLEKHIDSKNVPLAEWAGFVVKNYGWKSKAPEYPPEK